NAAIPALADSPKAPGNGNDANRHVDQEGQSPRIGRQTRAIADDPAAHDRAERRRDTCRPAPDAERESTLTALEAGRYDRQRRRGHHRSAHALDRTEQDQRGNRRGQAGAKRSEHEHDSAPDEDNAPPVLIAELTPRDQRRAED